MDKEPKARPEVKPEERLEFIIEQYLASNPLSGRPDGKMNEVEIRFGSDSKKNKITQIDYENVVKKLYQCGFKTDNPDGMHSLRVFHEYTDKTSGNSIMSNIRAEIIGIDLIQEYCRTNSIQKILDMPSSNNDKVIFTQKTRPKTEGGVNIDAADFKDFNIRIAYQLEQIFTVRSPIIRGIVQKWTDAKKTFRHMNRVRFYHETLPFFADLSIIRKSKTTNKGIPMKFYTIQDAGVLTNAESYEIEMEIDNTKVGVGTEYNNNKTLISSIRNAIRIIMGGIQGTNYPISYAVKSEIQTEYMRLLYGDKYQPGWVLPHHFVGPSSLTLQMPNVMKQDVNSNVPNIRKNYTVTDKADGERKLLYINSHGLIYMIDTNMNIIFTGARTANEEFFESLIDGEHIKNNKHGDAINLYAAFDIYYIAKKSTREFAFYNNDLENGEAIKQKYRLNLLKQFVDHLKFTSACEFVVKCKIFYSDTPTRTIFQCCSKILSDIEDGIYEYNSDGLIFTPCNTAVAGDTVGVAGKLNKPLWVQSFKWKPAEFNTIDFLVSMKKDKSGKDEIHNIFQDGQNVQSNKNIIQYKTLVLRCGYDELDRRHGFVNPYEDIIQNKVTEFDTSNNRDRYKPVPFQPTNPFDAKACFANIILVEDGSSELSMFTSEGEYFGEDMIVEFSYDTTKPAGWRWVPLRVRYDKTAELKSGLKNYGNAYHVANSNWQSIHQPITKEMISGGPGIPEYIEESGEEANEGVYYNRTGNESNLTRALRDFHNLYVKNKLINSVSNRNDTLIDYAVGKAGDLSKWISANLSFVLGVDISHDNIHNRLDGACARYLRDRASRKNMPAALFVNGDSGLNIRNGDAFKTQKDKEIVRAVFGNGPKDAKFLGQGVYSQYGAGAKGFNVSSCQFALHYFFETKASMHRFLRNLTECTAINGYFIGTCFDGKTIFQLLRDKSEGESFTIMNGERKMFELTKMYSQTGFPSDESCIGYPINVYQETIGKTFREYLVNFEYFIQMMENYGFALLGKRDTPKGLPNGTGLFGELFASMESETRMDPQRLSDYKNSHLMTSDEKQISFMNRYFVFRKTHNVDADKIHKAIMHKSIDELEPAPEPEPESKPKVRKVTGKKVAIVGQAIIIGEPAVP
jgi:mRNA (guanine-N7-)-methyltransferase